MEKIIYLFKWYGKLMLRTKYVFIMLIILPLCVGGLIHVLPESNVAAETALNKHELLVVDRESSVLSGILVSQFKDNDAFKDFMDVRVVSEELAMRTFFSREAIGILEIPEGFSQSLINIENKPLTLTLNSDYPIESIVLSDLVGNYQTLVESVEQEVMKVFYAMRNNGIDQETVNDVNELISIEYVTYALSPQRHMDITFFDDGIRSFGDEYVMLAFSILYSFISMLFLSSIKQSIIHEGIYQRLRVSHLSARTLYVPWILWAIILLVYQKVIVMWLLGRGLVVSDFLGFYLALWIFVISDQVKGKISLKLAVILLMGILGGAIIPIPLYRGSMVTWGQINPYQFIMQSYFYQVSPMAVVAIIVATMILGVMLFDVRRWKRA